jgi:hypothetical protein
MERSTMKDNQHVSYVWDDNGCTVTVLNHTPRRLVWAAVSDAVKIRCARLGMQQVRLSDKCAIERKQKDGTILSVAEVLDLKDKGLGILIDHYNTGSAEYEAPRMPAGERESPLTLEAMVRVYGGTTLENEDRIRKLANIRKIEFADARRVFAGSKDVAAAVLAIKTERLEATPAAVDAMGLLAELGE